MEIKTSAGRLLNIIEESKKIPISTKCIDAWAKILNTDKNDMPLLFKRLGSVMSLPSQVQKVVLNTEGISNTEPYLNWLAPINNAFVHQNLSANWDTFSKYINQHTINYLSMTTDMLNLQSPEATVEASKLKKFKTDFLDIEKEINESDLDIDLKSFMIKRVKDIINAIDEYKFNGIEPFQDALNITIGQIILNNELAIKSWNNSISKKFWNLIVNTSVVVTLATGVPQIKSNLQNLLPLIETNTVKEKKSSQKNGVKKEEIIDVEAVDDKDKTAYA